ncbi:MAG: hypothetical protein ACRDJB_13295 [Actinomycetota bacterium]
MHALISYDVAKLMLDDRLRAADDARLAHEIRTVRSHRRPVRSTVGRGLIALGARMSSRTQEPQHHH